jgi:hypothetical protein
MSSKLGFAVQAKMNDKQRVDWDALGRAAWLCNEWGEMSARARFLGALEALENLSLREVKTAPIKRHFVGVRRRGLGGATRAR